MSERRGSGLLFLVGAAVGAAAALFFSTDEKGELKDSVKDKVAALKKRLAEVDEEAVAEKIFGSRSKEVLSTYRSAKEQLVTKLAALKGSIDAIDKDKYTATVKEVVGELKKSTKLTKDELKKLQDYMVNDYQKISKAAKKK